MHFSHSATPRAHIINCVGRATPPPLNYTHFTSSFNHTTRMAATTPEGGQRSHRTPPISFVRKSETWTCKDHAQQEPALTHSCTQGTPTGLTKANYLFLKCQNALILLWCRQLLVRGPFPQSLITPASLALPDHSHLQYLYGFFSHTP